MKNRVTLAIVAVVLAWAGTLTGTASSAEVTTNIVENGGRRLHIWDVNTGRAEPPINLFLAYIVDTARHQYPDLLFTQEAGDYCAEGSPGNGCVKPDRTTGQLRDYMVGQAPADHPLYTYNETNAKGGAGVIYSNSRFDLVTKVEVPLEKRVGGSNGTCEASPWRGLVLKLQDNYSGQNLVVGSMHNPISDAANYNFEDTDCSNPNTVKMKDEMSSLGGNAQIMAGDFNHKAFNSGGGTETFWTTLVTNNGFHDVIWDTFGEDPSQWTNGTINKKRIDYIFTRWGSGREEGMTATLPFDDVSTSTNYSDHRAIGTTLFLY